MASAAPYETTSTSWAAMLILAILCIFPVVGMATGQYIDGRENVAYQCAMTPDLPEGILPVEDPLREASVTWMPAGRLCTFDASDGGTVSVQTGWPATTAGVIASAVAALLTIVGVRLRGHRRRSTTFLPMIFIVLIWVVVILSAHTVTV